jgi:hypothetical protein
MVTVAFFINCELQVVEKLPYALGRWLTRQIANITEVYTAGLEWGIAG